MNRRRFLRALGFGAAAGVAGASGQTLAIEKPSEADLRDYYALLWMEMRALAAEMGTDPFDHLIVHEGDRYERVKAAVAEMPPSFRSLPILTAAGLRGGEN